MNEAQLIAALTPDHHSRAAYVGRVEQTEMVTVITEDGTPYETEVKFYLSWDSIKAVLDLARNRAGIT